MLPPPPLQDLYLFVHAPGPKFQPEASSRALGLGMWPLIAHPLSLPACVAALCRLPDWLIFAESAGYAAMYQETKGKQVGVVSSAGEGWVLGGRGRGGDKQVCGDVGGPGGTAQGLGGELAESATYGKGTPGNIGTTGDCCISPPPPTMSALL